MSLRLAKIPYSSSDIFLVIIRVKSSPVPTLTSLKKKMINPEYLTLMLFLAKPAPLSAAIFSI